MLKSIQTFIDTSQTEFRFETFGLFHLANHRPLTKADEVVAELVKSSYLGYAKRLELLVVNTTSCFVYHLDATLERPLSAKKIVDFQTFFNSQCKRAEISGYQITLEGLDVSITLRVDK